MYMFQAHSPPYSACVLFELYESSGSHYVQLFYKNSTTEDLTPMNIPKCGTKCSLDELYDIYSDILPSDVESECSLKAINPPNNGPAFNNGTL